MQLPIAHYRLRFQGSIGRWPAYAGSAWRGVFGHQLRRALCVTHLDACNGCELLHSCGYPYIFETPPPPATDRQRLATAVPHPYVLEPGSPKPGGHVDLDLLLIGRGNQYLAYCVHALSEGARAGIGSDRSRLQLVQILQQRRPGEGRWEIIWEPEGEFAAFPAATPQIPPVPREVGVEFLTPLRAVRDEEKVLPSSFSFAAFFMTLLRRISLLSYFHAGLPLDLDFAALAAHARTVQAEAVKLRWQNWLRLSSRQQKLVPMGGVVGRFELRSSDLTPFWPFLWLGQWVHAGKGAVMGLGGYRLLPIPTAGIKTGQAMEIAEAGRVQ